MNKEVKGLLKYLFIMLIVWLMPLGMLYCGFGALYYDDNEFLSYLNLALAVVLFILYFILPVVFTYKAMKYHWSKYLDKFFYHKWLPTIVFVFFIILHACFYLYYGIIYDQNIFQLIATILSVLIAPTYYLTYIIMLTLRNLGVLLPDE